MPVEEDDRYVIHGPEPPEAPPKDSLGKIIYDKLMSYDGDEVAMVDALTNRTITYGSMLRGACTLSAALRRFGCDEDTVISISSENNLQFFVPVVASLFVGSIVAPVNPVYSDEEFEHSLNISRPRVIFVSQMVAERFIEVKKRLDFVERVIVFDADGAAVAEGGQSLERFLWEQLGGREVNPADVQVFNGSDVADRTAFIMSSSGTTGLPKGVMITHGNVAILLARSSDRRYGAQSNVRTTLIGIMPFFHAYGLYVGVLSIVFRGYVVVFQRFHEDFYLKAIQDHKVMLLNIAPPLAVLLAKSDKVKNYDLSSVVAIGCGAAPLSKNIENTLKERFKVNGIMQGYGLTEATLGVIATSLNYFQPGSVGKVLTFTSIKIRDPKTGRSLGPNQPGEICVKGPIVMKGYYNNPQATKEAFTSDGWLRTGDIGYYDEEKTFYIIDRLKELIKYKGYQVPPAELEAILLTHPDVVDAGVVGLPDEVAGELPLAFVVRRRDNLTEKELQNFIAKKVSPQKRLRGGVVFVDDIPKNPSGKILRKELRQMLKEMKHLKSKL